MAVPENDGIAGVVIVGRQSDSQDQMSWRVPLAAWSRSVRFACSILPIAVRFVPFREIVDEGLRLFAHIVRELHDDDVVVPVERGS
ncbi:hypothetical protein [Bifidobacterium rousetti]|uniref:hypothetical protein n=1 Tax=Bifidobacterium rousetti TaxID=2045439 RepID=UPI0037BF8479